MIPVLTNALGDVFTFNDGDCEDITTDINANLDFDAMPASPPSDGLLFDYNGASKTITVTGKLTLATTTRTSVGVTTSIDDQRKWLEGYIDGFQTGGTFSSNYSSTWNGTSWATSRGLVGRISFNESSGYPNQLSFTMVIQVGSV